MQHQEMLLSAAQIIQLQYMLEYESSELESAVLAERNAAAHKEKELVLLQSVCTSFSL